MAAKDDTDDALKHDVGKWQAAKTCTFRMIWLMSRTPAKPVGIFVIVDRR